MKKVEEQARSSEDVVSLDECGEPSEATQSPYMAIILESVDFGKFYSKDFGKEREGAIKFEFGDDSQEVALGFTAKVGFNVPGKKQLFAVQQSQKFSNALLYVGERKPLKLKVNVVEFDDGTRRFVEGLVKGIETLGKVLATATGIATLVPHPYVQAGSAALSLAAASSNIVAAAGRILHTRIDDDCELQALRGVYPQESSFTISRESSDSARPMELKFRVEPIEKAKMRVANVVITDAEFHTDTFGSSSGKQLSVDWRLGMGGTKRKANGFVQRINSGNGATIQRILKVAQYPVGTIVAKTNKIMLCIDAAVQDTDRAKAVKEKVNEFLEVLGTETSNSVKYAYELYDSIRFGEAEQDKKEAMGNLEKLGFEQAELEADKAELQARISALAEDDPAVAGLTKRMEVVDKKLAAVEKETETETRRKKKAEFITGELNKTTGTLDAFAYDLNKEKKEVGSGLKLGVQSVLNLAYELDSETMTNWMHTLPIRLDEPRSEFYVNFHKDGQTSHGARDDAKSWIHFAVDVTDAPEELNEEEEDATE